MDSAEMSKRTHFWLRLAAVAVIAAAAWLPRGADRTSASSLRTAETQTVHAAVATK